MRPNPLIIFLEALFLPPLEMVNKSFSPKKPPYLFLAKLLMATVIDASSVSGFKFSQALFNFCEGTLAYSSVRRHLHH